MLDVDFFLIKMPLAIVMEKGNDEGAFTAVYSTFFFQHDLCLFY